MDYLNEDSFKDLDNFIEKCTEKGAAISNVNEVLEMIDGTNAIPIRTNVVYVGELSNKGNDTLEYYQQCMDQGVELHEDEYRRFHELLSSYNEMKNKS